MGIELLRGRVFDARDRTDGISTAVINEAMADLLWPGQDPLGEHFVLTGGVSGSVDSAAKEFFPVTPFTVVGVVEDVRRIELGQPPVPEFYRPHAQMAWGSLALMIRTAAGDVVDTAEAVRRAVWELDPTVAVDEVVSMHQTMSRSVAAPRFRTLLLTGFAAVSCLLAMLGVYAVMAYGVSCRTREIGIRMALGARAGQVRRTVLANGLALSGLGIGLGLVAALLGSRAIEAMLFEVSPTDPVTLLAVAALVATGGALSSYLPARRASRVDPVRSILIR